VGGAGGGGLGGGGGGGLSGGGGGGLGGGGQGGQSGQGGQGGQGGGAQNQPLSRSVRLIIIGPATEVQRAKLLLEEADVAPPLVRIEAALVEVNRENIKDLGLGWDFANTKFTFTVPGAAGVDVGQVQRSSASFTASLQALITRNKARVLASPNISVMDNEDANIFIGDLLRFPGTSVVTPNSGTVQGIETIPVGIALLVRPRIHPNGEVTLKVHPVVSSVRSFTNGIPQTSSREADTTVRLKAEEELVIGGLSSKELTSTLLKVPILGDLPIIGQLFQTRNQRTRETEIIIFIRVYPVLTQPAPADQSGILPEDAPQRTDKTLRTPPKNK
jgi:type II secretory pathway component GspD/PulD (secretin)